MPDYKGLTIRFEGDASGLISTLQQIDSATERTTSTLSRINSALKLDPSNTRLYSAQTQELGRLVDSQETRLKGLNTKLKENKKEYDSSARAVEKAKRAMEEAAPAYAAYYEKYGEGIKKPLYAEADAYRDATTAMELHRGELEATQTDITLAQSKLDGLKNAMHDAQIEEGFHASKLGQTSIALGQYADGLDLVGDKLLKIGGVLAVGGVAGMLSIGRSVLSETEEYGNAISKVGGYLDITGAELEHMSELALQFGKDTRYSAVEAADAISELAKGGMTQAQIEGGALDATLQLASAGNLSLAQAAETAVQAINVFGLDAADASQVADALAGAANRSTAEVNTLAESFRYVSGWAGLADYPIQDVTGALGLLADRGLQAEVAGTGLRNVLQRIGAPTDKAKKLLEQYGFEAYNAEGKMKPLVELVQELNDSFGELGDQERNEVLNTIFGARGLPAAVALMDAGTEELEDYIDATKRVGYAEEMAQAQMGDLGWALEYLRGEFETFQVNLGSAFEPTLIKVANAAENLLTQFNNLSKTEQQEWAKGLVEVATLGPKLLIVGTALRGFGAATRGLSTWYAFQSNFEGTKKALGEGATLMQRFGSAVEATSGGAVKAEQAVSLLSTGIYLAGIAAAAFIAYKLWQEIEKDQKRTDNLNRSLEGARELLSGRGMNTNRLADSIYASGEAARETKRDVDEMLQSLSTFFDEVDDAYAKVEADSSRLNYAAQVIKELGGNANASAEDQEKLNGALAIYNSEAGTNYALHSDTGTVIYDENDAVIALEDSIYRLIEAQKAQARVAAIQNLLTKAYEEQYTAQQTLADAREHYFDIIDRRQRGETGWEVSDYQLGQARDAYYAARDGVIAADLAVDGLTESLEEETQAAMEAEEAIHNALAEHIVEFDTLDEALEEAGLNVNDFTGLSEQEFADMVAAAEGDMDVLAQLLSEWLLNHGDVEVDFEADTSGVEEGADTAAEKTEEVDSMEATVTMDGDTKPLSDAAQRAADLVEGVPPEYTVKLTAIDYISDAVARAKAALASLAGSYTRNPYNHTGGRAAGGIRTHAEGGIAAYANRYHAGGSIVNVPVTGYPLDLVGEAGAEAIVPLTNRRYSQPFVDLIADGVSRRMGAGTSYNLYINGARVNDDPQIRGQFIDLMTTLARKGAMNDGNHT